MSGSRSAPPADPGTIASTGYYDRAGTQWFDHRLQRWLPLTDQVELLTIVLEVDGTGGWTRRPGRTLMRFVGRPTSSTRGTLPDDVPGRTFMRLRPVTDDLPPDEFHCPGMSAALQELRHRLLEQGWIEGGRRGHPWSFRYHRQLPDWSALEQ